MTPAVCAGGLLAAQLAYWLPLKRRPDFARRAALNAVAMLPFAQLMVWGNRGTAAHGCCWSFTALRLPMRRFQRICVKNGLASQRLLRHLDCADLGIPVAELWRVVLWLAEALGMQHTALDSTPLLLGQLAFTVAGCVIVRYTMARAMPEDGDYRIGPRQLGSAGAAGGNFVFQFFALQTSLRVGLRPSAVVTPLSADAALLPDAAVSANRAFQKIGYAEGNGSAELAV